VELPKNKTLGVQFEFEKSKVTEHAQKVKHNIIQVNNNECKTIILVPVNWLSLVVIKNNHFLGKKILFC